MRRFPWDDDNREEDDDGSDPVGGLAATLRLLCILAAGYVAGSLLCTLPCMFLETAYTDGTEAAEEECAEEGAEEADAAATEGETEADAAREPPAAQATGNAEKAWRSESRHVATLGP